MMIHQIYLPAMKANRKAQLKMAETVVVLFIFFIILVIGIVFYSRMQTFSIKAEAEQRFQQKTISISQIISFMPEMQCSSNENVESTCFDYYKLLGFKQLTESDGDAKLYYFDHFGYANITIKTVYPDESEVSIYDNQLPDWTTLSNFPNPIVLHDPFTKQNKFGVLNIKLYR